MKKILLSSTVLLGMAVSAAAVWAQGAAPKSSTTITTEDVQKVLKLGPKETDHTIKVVEMGQGYQMAVGIVHRGSTRNRPAPSPQAAAARAAAQAKLAPCQGTAASAPAGAKIGPANGMLVHDDTAETYIITKGGGTLVTGGTLFGAKRDAADSPMTTTLNGPSCTGKVYGDFKVQNVKVGDIVIIPAGVPHGWSDIPQMVDYLSVRPDPKHVLPKAGYVYPGL
jgi:mannose-6-phosphate isomerase-like protein (cupin superfamily)